MASVNSLMSKKGVKIQRSEVGNHRAQGIVERFNRTLAEHFSTIIGERMCSNATPRDFEVHDNIDSFLHNSVDEQCMLSDITEDYVQKQISSMSVGKATGPDGISVKMIKIASLYIIYPHGLNIQEGND